MTTGARTVIQIQMVVRWMWSSCMRVCILDWT